VIVIAAGTTSGMPDTVMIDEEDDGTTMVADARDASMRTAEIGAEEAAAHGKAHQNAAPQLPKGLFPFLKEKGRHQAGMFTHQAMSSILPYRRSKQECSIFPELTVHRLFQL
jgi:hypothetical protein